MKRKNNSLISKFLALRLVQKSLSWITYIVLQSLFFTLRVDVQGLKTLECELEKLKKKDGPPFILAIWHCQLLLLGPIMRKFAHVFPLAVLISKSRDGELPSVFAETYRQVEVIRVGHQTRHSATLKAIDAIQENKVIVITPDGPRGPRGVVKPGIVFCAQKSGANILPFSWLAKKSIQLPTWDKFCLPLPFSKITVYFDEPVSVSENAELAEMQSLLQDRLKIL